MVKNQEKEISLSNKKITDLFINLFLNLYQEYKKGNIDNIVNYYYIILKK